MSNALRPLDDWDVFVLRHRKTPNIIVHLISFAMFWISPILALVLREPLLLVCFFLSGLVGTAGHYLFGDGTVDGKEATSSIQVVQFSSCMAMMFVTGRYGKEITKAQTRLASYRNGELSSNVDSGTIVKKIGQQNLSQLIGQGDFS